MSDHPFSHFKACPTRRLVLRPYTVKDLAAWREAWATALPPKNQWDSGARPRDELTAALFKTIVARQKKSREKGEALVLGAFDKKSGALLGFAVFEGLQTVYQSVNIGFEVFNNHWRRGYGTEIAQAMTRIALDGFGLHRVEALVNPANRPSLKVVKRVGMRREGVRKSCMEGDDGWHDMTVWALTQDDR